MSETKKNEAPTWGYILELAPVKNHPDPTQAVRALLKRALRDHGLRCRSLKPRPVKNTEQGGAS